MVLGESLIPGAGQGVFARRDLPPRTVAAFYNGLRVPVDERFPKLRFPPYCIKVGDVTDPCEEFIDLPVREGADSLRREVDLLKAITPDRQSRGREEEEADSEDDNEDQFSGYDDDFSVGIDLPMAMDTTSGLTLIF